MNWRIAATILCLLLLPGGAGAQLVEGRDYIAVGPHSVEPGGQIEVIEFFYYGCHTCYLLEPVLREWVGQHSTEIDFRLLPALGRSAWVPLSDLFFALDSLGVLPRLHDQVYVAIHEQDRRLSSRKEQILWASEQGLDPAEFEATLTSDATLIATQRARDATLAYGIRATPSIVVDGRFLTTGEMIGRASRVSYVLDGLLEMALAARGNRLQ
jgi:thiol:disulfide interchange protein DsbA